MKLLGMAPRLAFGCMALLGAMVSASPMDDRIPQDAILYVGWQGADALAPQYAGSNLSGIVSNSGLRAYLTQQMPRWIARSAENDPQAPEKIQQALTALTTFWHHPTALYVGPADWSDMKAPAPRIALLCDAGTDAGALVAILRSTIAAAPPKPAPHLGVSEHNGMVILTVGAVRADQLVPGAGMLRANADYQRVMKIIGGSDGAYTAYGDPQKFFATVNEGLSRAAQMRPEDRAKVQAVIETLGLQHLTQGGSTGGFDGKGWTDKAFLGTTGPRTGLLALSETAPIDDAALAAIPAEAAAFNTSRFELPKALSLAREVMKDIDPKVLEKFETALTEAGKQVGFDIENDLVASVGDLWTLYRMPSPDGVGIASVFVQPLKNADAFAKALTAVEEQINEKAGGRVQVEPTDADGIPVSAVQSPLASVAWTVRGGYFYVSNLAGISVAVNQVEKHQPAITTNGSFKATRASLPAVKPLTLQYVEPAKLYPEAYRVLSSTLPLLRAAKIDVPMRIFPTPAKATPFMTPGMSVAWSEEEGYHSESKSAYPGAELGKGGRQDGDESTSAEGLGLPSVTVASTAAASNVP